MLFIHRPAHAHELVGGIRRDGSQCLHVRRPIEVHADRLARRCLHQLRGRLAGNDVPLQVPFRADLTVVKPADGARIGDHPALALPLLGAVNMTE
ncbi:hypothetical protein D3C87_1597390 [compost metagenome]